MNNFVMNSKVLINNCHNCAQHMDIILLWIILSARHVTTTLITTIDNDGNTVIDNDNVTLITPTNNGNATSIYSDNAASIMSTTQIKPTNSVMQRQSHQLIIVIPHQFIVTMPHQLCQLLLLLVGIVGINYAN